MCFFTFLSHTKYNVSFWAKYFLLRIHSLIFQRLFPAPRISQRRRQKVFINAIDHKSSVHQLTLHSIRIELARSFEENVSIAFHVAHECYSPHHTLCPVSLCRQSWAMAIKNERWTRTHGVNTHACSLLMAHSSWKKSRLIPTLHIVEGGKWADARMAQRKSYRAKRRRR